MGYMDILYGIDNPLFLDLKSNPQYVFRTILPWLLKYTLTMPKIGKLHEPVEEYLSRFSTNQALIDIIAQHFFQKTPAYFALSYFSLYLDYRTPGEEPALSPGRWSGLCWSMAAKCERKQRSRASIPASTRRSILVGNVYRYRKLVWAADPKTLYRIVDLGSLTDSRAVGDIRAKQTAVSGKVGGDSVFTLYLTLNLDKTYFEEISSAHFFYTPSTAGLSNVRLEDLFDDEPNNPAGFIGDKARIIAWLERYLELTTYEISCPVLRDDALAPEGKTGLIISSLFDYSLTKTHPGDGMV